MHTVAVLLLLVRGAPPVLQQDGLQLKDLNRNFGVSDAALIDVLTGRARPEGKLPFEVPSSMDAVAAQRSDVPYPLTYGVDGVRGLLIGRTHFGVVLDVAVLVGVGVLFVVFGAWRFSKIEP